MPRYAYPPPIFRCQVDGCDKDAMSSTSRICRRHYMREWRARHPGYMAAYLRRWKAENPEKVEEYRRRERGNV